MNLILDIFISLLLFIWDMAKIIIPIMIIIEVFKDIKLIDKISKLLKPFTKFFNIHENSSISLVIGIVFGLLIGAGTIINSAKQYNLDKRSIFLICMFLSLCHAVIEDTLIFAAVGANLYMVLGSRILAAVLTTFVLSKLIKPNTKDILNNENVIDIFEVNESNENKSTN
ncbi:MAG: nucleoside recognition domain protein [Bacillota bacterium]|nr:nucleoside recognition domain protein [Bacillota bacterium]